MSLFLQCSMLSFSFVWNKFTLCCFTMLEVHITNMEKGLYVLSWLSSAVYCSQSVSQSVSPSVRQTDRQTESQSVSQSVKPLVSLSQSVSQSVGCLVGQSGRNHCRQWSKKTWTGPHCNLRFERVNNSYKMCSFILSFFHTI